MKRIPDWPRMMRRALAAAYCDLTSGAFEREVATGKLPMPVKLAGEDRWSRDDLDAALDTLMGRGNRDWRKEQPGLAA